MIRRKPEDLERDKEEVELVETLLTAANSPKLRRRAQKLLLK
jgi:hypothetical protein